MVISKWRIAAAVKRFPLALTTMHTLIRLTRPRFTAGAVGVLFNEAGEVLLAEHVYHSPPRWGLPGGYVDRLEDPAVTVAREMREELGLMVEVGPVVALQRSQGSHLDVAFLCHTGGAVGQLNDELLDYRWFPPDQLPQVRPFHRKAIVQALALVGVKV